MYAKVSELFLRLGEAKKKFECVQEGEKKCRERILMLTAEASQYFVVGISGHCELMRKFEGILDR